MDGMSGGPPPDVLAVLAGLGGPKGGAGAEATCPNCGCVFDPANPEAYQGAPGDSAPPTDAGDADDGDDA